MTLGNFDFAGHLMVMQIAATSRVDDEIAADAVDRDIARADRADFDIAAGAADADIAGTDRFDAYAAADIGKRHVARADVADLDVARDSTPNVPGADAFDVQAADIVDDCVARADLDETSPTT